MSKLIDVEKTLHSKNKGKKPPRFLIWLLKKIVHQDEINDFLRSNTATTGVEFTKQILDRLNVKVKVHGLEKLDTNGKYILASNHPLGGLDGLGLIHMLGNKFEGKFKLLANDILMTFDELHDITYPVNMHGSQGKDFAIKMNELFNSDNSILIFPAGSCSRFQPGKGVYDLDWKKTFITRAIQHKRDIVPIRFVGRNSIFFYSLAFLRKSLGIKLNIEMLFLSHEMFGNKNRTFNVYIGEPVSWQTFTTKKSHHKWALYVRELVYKLGK